MGGEGGQVWETRERGKGEDGFESDPTDNFA